MNNGMVEEIWSAESIYINPQRDYTKKSIAATPSAGRGGGHPPPAAQRPETKRTEGSAEASRSSVLGGPEPTVVKMAVALGYRPARNGAPVAPLGMAPVLEAQVRRWGKTTRRSRDQGANRSPVHGEQDLASSTDQEGAGAARA